MAGQTVDMAEGVIAMAVARLGGTVEGVPTQRVNFLQRIDELRAIETRLAEALSLIDMWREVDDSDTPTVGRYIALTNRRDTWLARQKAEGKAETQGDRA